MAKTLQNFLIGVGLDTENYDKGSKNVEGSLSRMRSLVGLTGSVILGAFGAAGVAAINAGKRVDELALQFEKFNISTEYVNNYGNAIRILGGRAEEAYSAINTMEAAIAAQKFSQDGIMPGEIDLARAGIDTNALRQAQTGDEMLRELARQIPSLNKEQQFRIQQTLGFSDAVMRSLREGVDKMDQAVNRAGQLAGGFEGAIDASRDFNRSWTELSVRFEEIGNTLAQKILPGFTNILDSFGGFIDKNKEYIGKAADFAGENPVATTLVAVGGVGGVAGAGLSAFGMSSAGGALSAVSIPAAAIGTGLMLGKGFRKINWAHPDEQIASWLNPEEDVFPDPNRSFGPEVPNVPTGDALKYLHKKPEFFAPNEYPGITGTGILPLNQLNIHPLELVYAGGEVSNDEAANASPDVIMVRDQRQQAERSTTHQRVNVQNNLEVRMEIDGHAFDSRVKDVVDSRERDGVGNLNPKVDR